MMDAVENAKAARDQSNSVVTDESIDDGALTQDTDRFERAAARRFGA
ncbi:MAG TPA: hypothetical protein VGQ18_02575 [Gemmatimonadales bacterium]|jgi:hypothetical protein|nr:hypothetical protein [Gemmatimonadales bacterium]